MEVAEGGAPVRERPRVLVFFDYSCPFCYVDWSRLLRLERERDIELFPIPFELRPDIPDEGISASEYGLSHPARVEDHLLRVAGQEGLPMEVRDHLPKTHLAILMGEAARDRGPEVHRTAHEAIFRAYYGHGADIGDRETLLRIAAEVPGLGPEEVERAWASTDLEERLHGFRHVALHLGVQATPAVLVCNELLIGTRPYDVLEQALDACLVAPSAVADGSGPEPA